MSQGKQYFIFQKLFFLLAKELCNYIFSSIYQDQGEFDENWVENCEVSQEFSEKNYRPSPDGDYVLKFVDPTNAVDMNQLGKLRVDISGSLIPIQSKKKLLI